MNTHILNIRILNVTVMHIVMKMKQLKLQLQIQLLELKQQPQLQHECLMQLYAHIKVDGFHIKTHSLIITMAIM